MSKRSPVVDRRITGERYRADVLRRPTIPARPRTVAVFALLVAGLFVLARLALAADGDVSRFVVAGDVHTDVTATPVHLHVFEGGGYDGQFYWRLALDPTDLRVEASNGVRFDDPLRAGRIAYPTIVWLLTLGIDALAAPGLVVVNVLALAALAWAGASIAVRHDRAPWWGLLASSATGLVMSLSRDLNEVVMAAAVVAGIAALQARRPWWTTAVCWALAVLAHEQALYVVAAFAAWTLWRRITRRPVEGRAELVWLAPVAAVVAWQSVASVQTGGWPLFGSGAASLGAPFAGLAREFGDLLSGTVDRQEWSVLPQFAAALLIVGAALRARASLAEQDRWLTGAVAVGAVLAVCLSYNVWSGPAELRQIALLPTLAGTTLLSSPRAVHRGVVVAVAVAWALTAALRTVAV